MNRPDIKRMPKRTNPLEAQRQLLEAVSSNLTHSEMMQVQKALGRVLAKDAISTVNIPNYDKTFIDGYAINSHETKDASTTKPVAFKVIGKLFPADYPTTLEVEQSEAVYVACGAPIPKGADSTVKVEETRLNDDKIEVVRQIQSGEGIIPLGDDMKKGDLILKRGQVLRPQDVGILASLGFADVEVLKKPRIAILSGGDELIKQCTKNPAIIANNYALVLAGLASELGAETKIIGIMPDALEKVTAKILEALEGSNIVVTIGGSSVGVKDFVPDAVNALGEPGVVVQGVSLRPGAISGFGILCSKPVIMLPGHIGSCIAGFYLFVAPLIRQYLGLDGDGLLPRLDAELTEDMETGPQFRFQFTHLKRVNDKLLADQVEGGSSALTTIVKSNGYIIMPPHTTLTRGSHVKVYLFGKLELSQIV